LVSRTAPCRSGAANEDAKRQTDTRSALLDFMRPFQVDRRGEHTRTVNIRQI